ncbi:MULTISPECIES: pyridoxal phosphate-dependent aminotransferase [unclassified Halanaerobium]|uniref:pyridoxal phosphate-dependent aminotransferase n=1 Tax=unclassified Halanaerobium TaxID=2641197 RepID=UPI000DF3E61E|nr:MULTISPECIES: pyridoxal phosphate-dependent aminotransferase [unclassified Halanaerobium]RCW50543.1 aspartate aminotransferase [Halanaerobium sp. MA284_MarDTE_T2]RCW77963.1 aspartate aminotransferase [Halanaerobium sp. DL-01]
MKLSSRNSLINKSQTIAVSNLASDLKAEGENVISFGAGEPDFPTPAYICSAADEAMEKGYTRYTPAEGLKKLRQAAADRFADDYGFRFSVDEIIASNGAKQVLYNIFQTLLDSKEEVIIPKPYWVSYPEMVKLADGVPIFVEGERENHFKLTPNLLNSAITDRTKAVIVNNPSNPDGRVYTEKELLALCEVVEKHDILLISDEIYEKFLFDDLNFKSIISLRPDLKDNLFIVNGMSKTYSMTGWRLGFGFGNKELIANMSKIQSHSTSNSNSITQYASFKALQNRNLNSLIKDRCRIYEERRDKMLAHMDKVEELSYIRPNGAFYLFVDISSVLGGNYKGEKITDSVRFAEVLLREEKVAVVPGAGFGMDDYIRMSFVLPVEEILEGIDRIDRFVKNFSKKR